MTDNGASSYHRFLQGDSAALEELIQTYSDSLVRYIFCYVKNAAAAEDLMEDTFAALIVKRKRFSDEGNFAAYLYRIARNKSLDYLRSPRKNTFPLCDFENVLHAEDAEREVLKRERDRKIYALLFTLSEEYRSALYLTYYGGLSVEELQSALHKSRKQVYNLLARAKSSLREKLEKEGIGYEDV